MPRSAPVGPEVILRVHEVSHVAEGSRQSENEVTLRALQSSYVPDAIREARERQDAYLFERFRGGRWAIADIGCGTGYHGSAFGPTCEIYHGFEISEEIAMIARDRWRSEGLSNATVHVGDVAEAGVGTEVYDLVFCLYFTPGNIRDPWDDLSLFTDDYLDRNPRFITVVSRFFRAMKPGGSMFLTVYKDVPEAEAAQIDFYENTKQHVVTPRGSRFVATAEGFWSARWTVESMLSNLRECGIEEDRVVFHDLNAIAWLVEIVK